MKLTPSVLLLSAKPYLPQWVVLPLSSVDYRVLVGVDQPAKLLSLVGLWRWKFAAGATNKKPSMGEGWRLTVGFIISLIEQAISYFAGIKITGGIQNAV